MVYIYIQIEIFGYNFKTFYILKMTISVPFCCTVQMFLNIRKRLLRIAHLEALNSDLLCQIISKVISFTMSAGIFQCLFFPFKPVKCKPCTQVHSKGFFDHANYIADCLHNSETNINP